MGAIKIVLKSGKDQSLMRYHPWVFSGAIKKIYGDPAEGDVVDVYDNKDNFLATGYYNPGSIAIRVMAFEKRELNGEYYRERISAAIEFRKKAGVFSIPETNVYRLVHGEGDGLPGLIIDYYDGVAVMQFHSVGIYREIETVCKVLREIMGSDLRAIYNKSESTLPFKADTGSENGYLYNSADPGIVSEYGYKFKVYTKWMPDEDSRQNCFIRL